MAKAKKDKQPGKRTWKLYDKAATAFAGIACARATHLVWRAAVGRKAPKRPENPQVSWREAATWAALSGAATQLAHVFATRKAADYWVRSTGTLPPGMKPVESGLEPDQAARSDEAAQSDQAAPSS